jgi:hypothetical protein
VLLTGNVFAQGQPAAQSAEDFGNMNITFVENRWTDLFQQVIKMPEQKDLFISATVECGLLTSDNPGPWSDAVVRLAVTVDGKDAKPGRYEICGKTNDLAPKFSELVNCTGTKGRAKWTECGMSQEQMDMLRRSLRTTTAHFVLKDVGVGVHTVKVKVFMENNTGNPARAIIGDGVLMMDIVRLVKGE